MNVPRGYPQLSPEEKRARLKAVGAFFSQLGVDADIDRIREFCNATCWIPWQQGGIRYFQRALDKAVREKNDKFNTAPQPGTIWQAFESLVPRDQWEYSPSIGTMPPRWARELKRIQGRAERAFAARSEHPAIAPEASDAHIETVAVPQITGGRES